MNGLKFLPKRAIAALLLVAILGIASWRGWVWWNWAIAAPVATTPAVGQKSVQLRIRPGTSAQEIGADLEALGLIRSASAWSLWSRWLTARNPQGSFQAGTYQLSPTESLPAIAARIWSGDVVQQSVTIPEGWTLQQMADYFQQQGIFSAQEFLTTAAQMSLSEYTWLPVVAKDLPRLEGYLYPDTYQFAAGSATPEAVIHKMLQRFEQVALPLYQQAKDKTDLSLAEWVTLASIVEKEAVVPAERPLIAGVFSNRLEKKMALGADPTVEYGLGIQQTPDRPLTLAEVRTDSPYNTYLHPGLPPTPIANPGLASLKAALKPAKTGYLYFVARYDGTHVFSRTLAEHQAAQNAIHDRREKSRSTAPDKPRDRTSTLLILPTYVLGFSVTTGSDSAGIGSTPDTGSVTTPPPERTRPGCG